MTARDPYQVLGVSRKASQAEIKKAYRGLAKKLHPDLHPDDKSVANRFKEVSVAYDLLSDPDKRARFDRGEIDADGTKRADPRFYGRQAGAGPRVHGFETFGGGINPEELFAELFGNFRGGQRAATGKARPTAKRGGNRRYHLKIAFLDAVKGCKTRIKLPRGKTLDVTIPAAIEDGQTVRIKGQGGPGRGGAAPGDLLIDVEIEPHAFFARKGNDIIADLPVTLPEAMFGAKVKVPTIDGRVTVSVPRGSNSGTSLRLKGKGIRDAKSGKRGDQYLQIKVMLPEKRDSELERLIAEWSETHDYDVRSDLVDA